MAQFMERHPFTGSLIRRVVSIIVTWNVVMLCLIATLFSLGLFFGAMALFGSSASAYVPVWGQGYNQLLSIKVNGVMMGSSAPDDALSGLFGDDGLTYGYDVKDRLYAAAADDTIAGIILEIDSPGGTIYGARAIADGVAYYREQTKKPVYAHIEGMGASAAYWAAASADRIYVDHGSSVGSIGVIMGPFEYYDKVVGTEGGILGGGVLTQNGIQSTMISAGKYKDIGNPFRRLSEEETRILQRSINIEYDQFVQYVGQRRSIPDATIRNDIGAMIYDATTAKRLKLVDEAGSRQDAYAALAEAAQVGDDYVIVGPPYESSFAEALFAAVTRRQLPQAQATSKAAAVDLCPLTQNALAYHGDITGWCVRD